MSSSKPDHDHDDDHDDDHVAAWPLLVLALALLLALPALPRAAPYDGTQSVDAYSGLAMGSGRIVGLAGAYVAVSEGVGGVPVNPASVAHRRRGLGRRWDVGGTLSYALVGLRQGEEQDGGIARIQLAQMGLGAQLSRLGAGLVLRSRLATTPPSGGGSSGIETTDVHLAGGWAAFRDALVLGGAVDGGQGALVQYGSDGKEQRRLRYDSTTFRSGALWRPRGVPLRVGAAYDFGGRARARGDRNGFPGAPQDFAFPWNASVGAALWLGPNAARMNEPPEGELARHPEWGAGPAWEATRVQPLLVTIQLDWVGPVKHAVSVATALAPEGGEARTSGVRASLVPRAGAEWECLPDRLRLRGGSYLEPSRNGGRARAHGTFGAELRLWRLQLAVAGDLARGYGNLGFSLWFWHHLGPLPPPDQDPSDS